MIDKIDIKAARKLTGQEDGISTEDWNQVLDELENAREQVAHSEMLATRYHESTTMRDRLRIYELKTIIANASCSLCGTINMSPQYCSHIQPCRPVYARLEQANIRISELEKELKQKSSSQLRIVPKHWPPRYNANNDPCDMIDGPCACGAWHDLDEEWVQINLRRYGEKQIEG